MSSTYNDLRKERQTAVQAVLDAGHIPAGMELFSAGDEAQLEVIKRWIDDSDVYMLILGARYGSIEPTTKKSYTHVEYEYAVERGKPVFAVYIADAVFNERVTKELALEIANEDRTRYKEFRELVKSKMCSEFSDPKDITIAVLKTLNDFGRRPDLQNAGWVRRRDVPDTAKLTSESAQLNADIARLTTEIARLTAENSALRVKSEGAGSNAEEDRLGSFTYRQLVATLGATRVGGRSLLDNMVTFANDFVMGVADPESTVGQRSNAPPMLYNDVAPKLATFGLLKRDTIYGAQAFRTSEAGDLFLARLAVERAGAA
ncbi:DUF4062 domain-containing protein [Polyangium sp. 15x6]|uniref:DUF4062 domain-containing protein n=1 Tax=Polyangium sp. 15x6 TaxID=3042687 RepID=UPI002499E4C0|nr:DUF4062 domain-containing protein [Polyangium sp. 15x6]MDI3289569.1 DUF4062 domain-containing protein [Polyangium sp. 15x6]